MAVTTSRPQQVSAVPSYVFGALKRLLFGYDLSVVGGALLCIKPESGRNPVQEAW